MGVGQSLDGLGLYGVRVEFSWGGWDCAAWYSCRQHELVCALWGGAAGSTSLSLPLGEEQQASQAPPCPVGWSTGPYTPLVTSLLPLT